MVVCLLCIFCHLDWFLFGIVAMLFATWNTSVAVLKGECILSILSCVLCSATWNTVGLAILLCLHMMVSVLFLQTS